MKRVLLVTATAILLPPLLLIGGFYGWENWRGQSAWREAERRLVAAGEPLTFAELAPRAVPDAENMAAAPVFRDLFTFHNPHRAALYRVQLPPAAPPSLPAAGAEPELIALARRFEPDFQGDAAAAAQVVLDGLAPMDPVLRAMREAATRPEAVWPEPANARYDRQARMFAPLRRSAEVLAARATVAVAERQPDRALADFELVARLAGSAREPATLASGFASQGMLNNAVEIVAGGLAAGTWSDPDLARIDAVLASFDPLEDFRAGVRGERVVFLESSGAISERARQIFTFIDFRSPVSAWITGTLCQAAWALRPSGWLARDRARYALHAQEWIDQVIHNRRVRPWALADWNARMRAFTRDAFGFFQTPLSGLALPTLQSAARSAAYAQTRIDLARLAIALERCRRATGALPHQLDELAPRWIPAVPRDVVGGAPYRYRAGPDGSFQLYGQGWNARDDGGRPGTPNALLGPSTADDWLWPAG